MKNLKRSCNDCKYFGTDELDDPCFSCFDDNCHWEKKDQTGWDCGTCKYETLRAYESPCNTCRILNSSATNWAPREEGAINEMKHCSTCKYGGNAEFDTPCFDCRSDSKGGTNWVPRATVINTVVKLEDILRDSGLPWSMTYIPSTKSYSIYLSDTTDVESDE